MAILNIQMGTAGLAAVAPSFIFINTDDSYATVTAAGYLNASNAPAQFSNSQMALVRCVDGGVEIALLFHVEVQDGVVTLVAI